jgi:uncharacterized RDD family membrane protein YckC
MFCSRCGQRVEEGTRYCQICGQEVGSPGTPPANPVSAPVSKPLPYAGFWVRFVALLIDGVILSIPFFLVAIGLVFRFRSFHFLARGNRFGPPDAAFMGPVILGFFFAFAIFIVVRWVYFAGMESSARQATFGKVAMSVYVTDLKGQPVTFGRATGRFFAKIVSGLIPLGIGYIMAGFTEKKQALHDMIAGTLVVRKL